MPSDLSCPTVIQIMWPGIDTTEWVTITTIKILIFTNNLKTFKDSYKPFKSRKKLDEGI